MLRLSKILHSREEWKSKAMQRAYEIREHKKTQKRYQLRMAELKTQVKSLKAQVDIMSEKNEPHHR